MNLLFLLLFFTGCAEAQLTRPRLDEELRPYRDEFRVLVDTNKYDKILEKTEIFFLDLKTQKTGLLGRCSQFDWNYRQIMIDFNYWKKASYLSRQFTMMHEFGHCICLRIHTAPTSETGFLGWMERLGFKLGIVKEKGLLKDGCPASLMHPSEFSEWCMQKNYDHYMQEFKKGCQ